MLALLREICDYWGMASNSKVKIYNFRYMVVLGVSWQSTVCSFENFKKIFVTCGKTQVPKNVIHLLLQFMDIFPTFFLLWFLFVLWFSIRDLIFWIINLEWSHYTSGFHSKHYLILVHCHEIEKKSKNLQTSST